MAKFWVFTHLCLVFCWIASLECYFLFSSNQHSWCWFHFIIFPFMFYHDKLDESPTCLPFCFPFSSVTSSCFSLFVFLEKFVLEKLPSKWGQPAAGCETFTPKNKPQSGTWWKINPNLMFFSFCNKKILMWHFFYILSVFILEIFII